MQATESNIVLELERLKTNLKGRFGDKSCDGREYFVWIGNRFVWFNIEAAAAGINEMLENAEISAKFFLSSNCDE